VLPFESLGSDASDDYLADGITEDLTTDLSHVPGAFVIARKSAYAYRGKPTDVRQVGSELGVRYVLEGSVRKLGTTLRVNARLVSTETGADLWTDRFDEQLASLGRGQDEIVRRIGTALGIEMVDIESARSLRERAANPDAFDLVLRARSLRNRSGGRERDEQALALYEQALRLDPTSAPAMLGIASILIERNFGTLGEWTTADDMDRAAKLIASARTIEPNSERGLVAAAELVQARENWAELTVAAQRIVDLYPNSVEGYELLGFAKRHTGTIEETVQLFEKAIQLNPRESNLFHRCGCMGYALLLVGRYEEAILWTERSLAFNPEASSASRGARYLTIAAAYALSGRLDAAQTALSDAHKLWPFATARMFFPDNPSNVAQVTQIKKIIDAMRLAGLPDHAEESADFGVPADNILHTGLAGFTPTSAPGATVIQTQDLMPFLAQRKPIVIDTVLYSWGRSIPNAIGLTNAGLGGSISDAAQDRLRRKMQELTNGDPSMPIIAVGWNSERFDGRNLALRLVALGYTQVYWYRGGREAWEVNGLPETDLMVQGWQ
jgi:TolB-like protein